MTHGDNFSEGGGNAQESGESGFADIVRSAYTTTQEIMRNAPSTDAVANLNPMEMFGAAVDTTRLLLGGELPSLPKMSFPNVIGQILGNKP